MLFYRTLQFIFVWVVVALMLVPVGQLVGASDPFEWAVYASGFLFVALILLAVSSLGRTAYEGYLTVTRLGEMKHELTDEMLEAAKQNRENKKQNGTTKD